MTVKELIEMLEQFDGDKTVCISDNSRYGNVYAYGIRNVKEASFSAYWSDDDKEEDVVRILLGEQIGTVE